MYAIHVTVRHHDTGRTATLCYGPYKSLEKAQGVRLALSEQAFAAPAFIDVTTEVMPLVRFGLPAAIEDVSK